jgi:alpha-glucosidase
VTLLVYPEGTSSFSLYEDDGLTNAYRDGCYAETRFTCTADASGVTVHIDATQGETSLLPAGRRYLLKLRTSQAPHDVTREGAGARLPRQQATEPGWWHDGAHFLFVRMPPTPCTARIAW